MKLSLFLSKTLILSLMLSMCNKKAGNENQDAGSATGKVIIDSLATSIDSLSTPGAETKTGNLTGVSGDSLSKDEKYKTDNTQKHEAPKHSSPDQMKIDSIKKSKDKKKKD